MKAILHTKFGSPYELQLKEIDKPYPKDNEVLIKIHTTSVTSTDCNVRNFTFVPGLFLVPARIMFGVFKPRINILGFDLAGKIEAVGKDVKRFKEGDQIFGTAGTSFGALAEYKCMPEDGVLTIKPDNLAWEEAGAVFLGAHTALFFLRDKGNIQAGQRVLIYGASGGVGTFAVQLAKYFGANVTGVCSTNNIEMVKSLGADMVIDYTKEDFTKSNKTYDLIFDTVGKTSFSRCKGSLKQKGVFLTAVILIYLYILAKYILHIFLSDQARTAIIRHFNLEKGRFSCLNTPFLPLKQHCKNFIWISNNALATDCKKPRPLKSKGFESP